MLFPKRWLRRRPWQSNVRQSARRLLGAFERLEGRELLSANVTAFRLPRPGRQVAYIDSIFKGPTGAVWVAENLEGTDANGHSTSSERLFRISRNGHLTSFPIPASVTSANSWAVGPDGNLWFTTYPGSQTSAIGRLTLAGGLTLFPVPGAAGSGLFLTAGGDGNLWFAGGITDPVTNQNETIVGRVTPDGQMTQRSLPVNGLVGVAADAAGNAWVTRDQDDATSGATNAVIDRITPSGQLTQTSLGSHFAFNGPTIGPDGNIWAAAGAIFRFNSSGRYKRYRVPPDGNKGDLVSIIPGAKNRLFFQQVDNIIEEPTTNGVLGQITTAGRVSKIHLSNGADPVGAISIGRDGNLWFDNSGNGSWRPEIDRLRLS